MKQEIITYLAGPRNFIQGVELYEKYGINRMLKKSFRRQGDCLLYTSPSPRDS